ncbi:MAG TPA: glycosyltransferase family 4 protein [Acidimicrobiia bacterium]
MRVLVVSSVMPFVDGGGTLIVDWLEEGLREHGHQVDVVRLPFRLTTRGMPARVAGMRLFDVAEHGDRMIAIRYPAHVVRHPQKVVWFIHHHRPLFDLWGTRYQDVLDDAEGRTIREMLRCSDNVTLAEARRLFTNSQVVGDRLRRFNGLESEVLYPPVAHPERFRTNDYGDFIFYPSRVNEHKRQSLAVEALAHTTTPVRLVLAGQFDDEHYPPFLEGLAREAGVIDRLTILRRWISEEEKIALLADCLAVAYLPYDEDSYGFPSLEAHHSRKAVITTTDGGGTLELVGDGVNGFVSKPDPVALAACFDQLWEDRNLAQRMGEAGEQRVRELGIDWSNTITRLLA